MYTFFFFFFFFFLTFQKQNRITPMLMPHINKSKHRICLETLAHDDKSNIIYTEKLSQSILL
jgi:hypothetical protein